MSATDFMTPKSEISQVFRNAVLELAGKHAFARPLVNSGRLSMPCIYDGFPHFGPDALQGPARSRPGAACSDAPVADGFLLDHLNGGFMLLALGMDDAPDDTLEVVHIPAPSPELAERYLGNIIARWPDYDAKAVAAAMENALGKGLS